VDSEPDVDFMMPRSGTFFVALCMVAIAASAAVLAYAAAAVEAGAAAALGFGLLLAMVIGQFGSQRASDRLVVDARLTLLARSTSDLARDIEEMARRIEKVEASAPEQAKAATQPIADEIGELGHLVKQFAETLQVHEAAIIRASAPEAPGLATPIAERPAPPLAPPPPMAAAAPMPAAPVLRREAEALQRQLDRQAGAGQRHDGMPDVFAGMARADAIAVIDEAISAKRYELFLQPIVTLPQRKVRAYQASVRLRGADGAVFQPADYLRLADDAGLMPALDAEILGRCIQVVRRLTARNRDVSLFCDIAGSSLADAAFSTELVGSLEASRSIAGSLVVGLTQEALRTMSPLDVETLRALSDKGFRFSMDGVRDLRIEPRDLADKGVRHIKVPADLMIARATDAGAEIHVADLAGLFARYGIDLIAEGIDTEAMVVDVLDYDVKFAQGLLFSPPRPVRADVLAGAEPAGTPQAPATAAARTRTEPRVDPRPAAAPQTLGAAVLAAGAAPRDQRKPGIGQGLRALIRDRS
jgi:cyclic-di-GMP phosphodiesterase TipF (flagellum assembly factor)